MAAVESVPTLGPHRPRSPAPRDEPRPQRDNQVSARLVRDNQVSARPVRDNHDSARPVCDNQVSARLVRDNHDSARPVRDNQVSARLVRDNQESARPVRNNHDSEESPRPVRDSQVSARLVRDNQESGRPVRDFQRRDEFKTPRDYDQAGSERTYKNTDGYRGGRGGRGRNFNPRSGEMRRPNFANNSPRESSRDGQDKPYRNFETGRPHAMAPPGVSPLEQVIKKPEVKHEELKKEPEVKRDEPKETKPLITVADVTPVKKMIPMNCVIDTLSVGEEFLLSVDAKASDCRVDTAGYVCLCLHADVQDDYMALCEPFSEDCNKEPAYKPSAGEAFAYFNNEEMVWYRARLLAPNMAALFDSSKVITIGANDKCHRLPDAYRTQPEFSCVLHCDKANLEQSLVATITSKTPTIKVTLVEDETPVGEGTVARWLPKVDYPKPEPKLTFVNGYNNQSCPVVVPEVSRPDIKNNSRVFLVDCTGLGAVFVRPCEMNEQRAFDSVLQQTALYALKAKPLTEPPVKGTVVISKFTDGNCYRALVKRTNVDRNRYLLEYLEFGNIHVNQLENLYACPSELNIQSRPVVTAHVTIGPADIAFTPAATEYIDKLKETAEMLLTAETGDAKVPSGSSVNLIVIKGNVNLSNRLQQMCKPEWKKMEEAGGDVVEAEKIMFTELKYIKLPPGEFVLDILDVGHIQFGMVNGCPVNLPHAKYVLTRLTQKMGDYCNSALGRDPYLPRDEELCIAQMPPYEQWFRAVKISQEGVGGSMARIMYIDYGTVDNVPVSLLRKMLPEFVRDLPAIGVSITIKDFPKNPSNGQLAAALQYMQADDEGRGLLPVTRCEYDEANMFYTVTAPGLIDAIRQA